MADKNYRVIHRRSVVVEEGHPKLPTSAQTEYGEISINYADGYETLSIRNNNDEIVTFSSDEQIKELIPNIISTVEDYMQVSAATGDIVDAYVMRSVIRDNELVTSQALNNLNSRTNSLSSSTQNLNTRVTALENSTVDLSSVASAVTINGQTHVVTNGGVDLGDGYMDSATTKDLIDNMMIKTVTDFSGLTASGTIIDGLVLKQVIEDDEFVTAQVYNDLNLRMIAVSGTAEDLDSRVTTLENETVDLSSVASAVTINEQTYVVSNGGVDLGTGYTKQSDIANMITGVTMNNSAATVTNSVADLGDVVTSVIINESATTISGGVVDLGNYIPMSKEVTISSAFNDLNDRVLDLEDIIADLQATIVTLQDQIAILSGTTS